MTGGRSFSLLILFSLISVAFSSQISEDERFWVVVPGIVEKETNLLMTEFDFRGVYGDALGLLVATDPEISSLEKKLTAQPVKTIPWRRTWQTPTNGEEDVGVWFVQFKPKKVTEEGTQKQQRGTRFEEPGPQRKAQHKLVKKLFQNGDRQLRVFFLGEAGDQMLVEVSFSLLPLFHQMMDEVERETKEEGEEMAMVVEAISVPNERYYQLKTPPAHLLPIFDNIGGPNPIIQQYLKAVSQTRIKSTITTLSSFHTRLSTSEGVASATKWLVEKFSSFTNLNLSVSVFEFKEGYCPNVVAELKGSYNQNQSDPNQKIIIVGAHYDDRAVNLSDPLARAPGADDDGSGIANLLEIATVLNSFSAKFYYTIRFIAFCGEEQGLVGSRAYAAHMRSLHADIIAMFNSDMLGYKLPSHPITLGMKDRYVAKWLLSVANSLTNLYLPELPIAISNSCCSDHQSFYENGFPSIGYFENQGGASDNPNYHKPTDVPEYLNYDQIALFVQAIMSSVTTFAVPLPSH